VNETARLSEDQPRLRPAQLGERLDRARCQRRTPDVPTCASLSATWQRVRAR
jgi:hypothetical protein